LISTTYHRLDLAHLDALPVQLDLEVHTTNKI